MNRQRLGIAVPGLGYVPHNVRVAAGKDGHRLVKRHPQRLSLGQRVGIVRIAAEVVQVLLHLMRLCHGLTQVPDGLAGVIELFFALFQPVLQVNVIVTPVARINVQFVGAVHRDSLLYVAKQLFEIDDVAVVLVVAIQPVGAANGLKQVVVTQFIVQINIGAAWRVKAGQQLAHHNQQLQVGGLFNEAALHLGLVLLGGGKTFQHKLCVSVELVSLIAVCWLQHNRAGAGLKRSDDSTVLPKRLAFKQPKVVASVVNAGCHQNRCAPVVA